MKTVVITGAARGIGLELAKQAITKGCRVYCGARSPEKATELREILGSHGEILPLDVSEDASVRRFADALRTRTKMVDVLINNAGVYLVKTLAVDETSLTALALHPGWVKTEMGGSAAPLEPAKSAEGLWTVIETSTPSDSGKFFNHAGRELPW